MRKFISKNVSVLGYSHKLSQKECQDSSLCWDNEKYNAAIVCDGHGGDKYIRSAIGSRLACTVGQKVISEFMSVLEKDRRLKKKFLVDDKQRESMILQLCRAIIQEWNKSVTKDCESNPIEMDVAYKTLSDEDKQSLLKENSKAYGSTFVAAVLSDLFYMVLKLGDGNVCIVNRSGDVQFAEKKSENLRDGSLQFNLTTSLCSRQADADFRYAYVPIKRKSVRGMILTSDGVINSYTSEEGFLRFMKNIYLSFCDRTMGNAVDELESFLPKLSQKGSGDDLSVAIICKLRK